MPTLALALLSMTLVQEAPSTGSILAPPVSLAGRALGGDQVDRYPIALAAGDALVGAVTQHGIDVIVTIRDPQGRAALEVDSPNGTDGPESLAYVATIGGTFAIEVRPFARGAETGRYDLTVEPVRAATARERGLAEALRLYAAAMTARSEALALLSRGSWQETMRRYGEARAGADRALALRTASLGDDHYDVAAVHALLGLIDDEVGNYASGEAHFGRAVAILERLFGPDHPNTLAMRSDLGYLMLAAGRWREAATLFQATIERRDRLAGLASPVANGLGGLGSAWYRLADYAAAERVIRREITLREHAAAAGGALGGARLRLAMVLLAQHEVGQAEALCQAARAALEIRPDADQLTLANAHACLAEVRLQRHEAMGALEHARQAAALREACQGPDHPATAEALTALGRAFRAARDTAQAQAVLERAAGIQQTRLGAAHPLLADTLGELAAAVADRDPARARSLYDRAIAIRSAALPASHPALAEAKAERARLHGR